jgi:hypothetical protein
MRKATPRERRDIKKGPLDNTSIIDRGDNTSIIDRVDNTFVVIKTLENGSI